jgi:serine protease Do
VILTYNGKEVTTSSALPPLVGTTPVGESAHLEVLRQGHSVALEVKIAELPEDDGAADDQGGKGAEPAASDFNRLGMVAIELRPEQREQLGIAQGGALVERVKEGPAAQAGLTAGDVILMLDNQTIDDVAGLNRILEALEPGRSISVLIQRGEGRMFYALRVPKL